MIYVAFPDHWAFQFGGTLLNGQDIWTNTIRFANPDGGGPGVFDEEDALDDLMADLTPRFQGAGFEGGLGYSSNARLEWGKFNRIAPNGAYADPGVTHVRELATPVGGGFAAPHNIPQVSLAVSWVTSVSRGYASKGRVFVAMPGVSPDNTGHVPAAQVQEIATNWGTMLDQFGDWPGLDLTTLVPCVISNVPLDGAIQQITGVRVGDVLDTIRTRRNALVENYSSAPVTAP